MVNPTMLAIFLLVSPLALVAQLPSGAIALYPLDNAANDVSGNGYNGTLTSTTAGTNRFSSAASSTQFTSGSSTGTLPQALVTAMQNDFSIGYWFNTTMTAPTGSQWYNGAALVDAEVCGGTTDWGTALIDGGKVSMGIGNPDITIKSTSASYNNGAWHFVTATRSASAGVITLYVDGSQVATASGTATTARSAPTFIGLGRNDCVATGSFTGSLDDIIAYGRTLSSTEVTNLYNYYNSNVLPLRWVSFTARAAGAEVVLEWQTADVAGNDHFEIERSADGASFITIASLPDGSRGYTDPAPLIGSDLYRVRQVDMDGRYSFSSTVSVRVTATRSGVYLQSNPVRDMVTLVNPSLQPVRRLQVVDISGRILIDRASNSSGRLISESIQHLNPGYYFLRVVAGETTTTIGFIKL